MKWLNTDWQLRRLSVLSLEWVRVRGRVASNNSINPDNHWRKFSLINASQFENEDEEIIPNKHVYLNSESPLVRHPFGNLHRNEKTPVRSTLRDITAVWIRATSIMPRSAGQSDLFDPFLGHFESTPRFGSRPFWIVRWPVQLVLLLGDIIKYQSALLDCSFDVSPFNL